MRNAFIALHVEAIVAFAFESGALVDANGIFRAQRVSIGRFGAFVSVAARTVCGQMVSRFALTFVSLTKFDAGSSCLTRIIPTLLAIALGNAFAIFHPKALVAVADKTAANILTGSVGGTGVLVQTLIFVTVFHTLAILFVKSYGTLAGEPIALVNTDGICRTGCVGALVNVADWHANTST